MTNLSSPQTPEIETLIPEVITPAIRTIHGVILTKDVHVTLVESEPRYPFIDNGVGEVELSFGERPHNNVMPSILINALVVNPNEEIDKNAQVALRMFRPLQDRGELTVTLHRQGAVALAGALSSFAERHGGNRFDGVTKEDLDLLVERLHEVTAS